MKATRGAKNPLSGLTAEEIIQTRNILADNGFAEASVRFAYVGLEEPTKADVLTTNRLGRQAAESVSLALT